MFFLSRKSLFISFCLGILFVVLFVCYYTVRRFIIIADRTYYGNKQSVIAREVQDRIFKVHKAKKVSFFAEDGLGLSAILLLKKNPILNVVLCHGYTANKEYMGDFVDYFTRCNLLLFDFRGHGSSHGEVTSLGCHEYKDVIAAARFLKQKARDEQGEKAPQHTILLGISMGGAACLKAVYVEKSICDALIIDSTFANLETMFLHGYYVKANLPYYPFFPIIRSIFQYYGVCDVSKMKPIEYVASIRQPILFIHSCNDEFIPPANSLQLYAAGLNRKNRLWITPPCEHGWVHIYHRDRYLYKVKKFLNETVFADNLVSTL